MTEKQYKTVRDERLLRECFVDLYQSQVIALDVESTGLNTRKDQIVGMSFTTKGSFGWYIPTLVFDPEKGDLLPFFVGEWSGKDVIRKLLPILVTKKLVMHNGGFDTSIILSNYGVDLLPYLWMDTMLAMHTIQEEGAFGFGSPFALKSIAKKYQNQLGLDVDKAANEEQIELKKRVTANGGKTTSNNFEIYKADLEVLSRYACADTDLTYRLGELFLPILKEEGLLSFFFEEEVMPIYKEVTVPMERKGIRIDLNLIQETQQELEADMDILKKKVISEMLNIPEIKDWVIVRAYLEEYPPKNTGKFKKAFIDYFKLPIIKGLKDEIAKLPESKEKRFLLGDIESSGVSMDDFIRISLSIWRENNGGDYINIQSKQQLGEICFTYLAIKPLTYTKKGAPQFDEDFVIHLAKTYEWANSLLTYNKLLKIKGTYVDRFLNETEDGIFYAYFKQHGTVTGRYGSNLQQLPKPIEDDEDLNPLIIKYTNKIRAFFVSRPGMVFIDSDYESLEPHIFASVSGDENLQEIFNKGHDFYSTVAIRTERLTGVSPDKKADNFLKKVDPAKRNRAKPYSLGIPYGMSGYALAKLINVPPKEGEQLREDYLKGFPGVARWMKESLSFFKENGYVRSLVGRIRHLFDGHAAFKIYGEELESRDIKAKEAVYGEQFRSHFLAFKKAQNNCTNFQIQSLAASIVNRAALQINRALVKAKINGLVICQIHDQLIVEVPEEAARDLMGIVQQCMETTTTLPGVTLKAPPQLAYNFLEGH